MHSFVCSFICYYSLVMLIIYLTRSAVGNIFRVQVEYDNHYSLYFYKMGILSRGIIKLKGYKEAENKTVFIYAEERSEQR